MENILADQSIVSNRYQIVRQIGRGGMGAVYETIDLRLQTTVALKQYMAVDGGYRQAFEREARILAKLRHPGLPIVSDHFFDGEDQFLVMEYVAGPSLYDVLADQQGPLAEAEALRIADQLLEILEYLHTYSPPIIHRDIKPQNIKISGEGRRAVLLDFGLAKGSPVANAQTMARSIFGYTRNYAPPEQINNTGTDQRTDLYSLGATLYHMLTGEAPAPAEIRMFAAVNGHPDPLKAPTELNPRLSRDVSTVCVSALALPPANRYQSAHTMRTALRLTTPGKRIWPSTSTTQLDPTPQPTPTPQSPTPARDQSQRVLIIIALVVLALVAIVGVGATLVLTGSQTAPTTTLVPPTAVPPTRTPRPSTTPVPSATLAPPTSTSAPPTSTSAPPTSTSVPPSATSAPPTDTPAPTRTPKPQPKPTTGPQPKPTTDTGGIPEPPIPTIAP